MSKFGLLWKDGRGERAPKRQRERFEAEGVNSDLIGYSVPATREGDTLFVDGIDFLGADPEGMSKDDPGHLAVWYARQMNDGGLLRDVSTGKEYRGVWGLAELVVDWLKQRRRRQTANARKMSKKEKNDLPGFYRRTLTPVRQQELKERFLLP